MNLSTFTHEVLMTLIQQKRKKVADKQGDLLNFSKIIYAEG